LRRQNQPLQFIKGAQECDFVYQTHEGVMPLQVAYDLSHPDTLRRELNGLVKAAEFLKVSQGLIITLNESRDLVHHNIEVKIRPAWQFLLS
jgi:predicted AAA+ superfamily ATPase